MFIRGVTDGACLHKGIAFSWKTDTTTLAIIRKGILPNATFPANALYNIVVAVVVLNSRIRFEIIPLDITKPLTAGEFASFFFIGTSGAAHHRKLCFYRASPFLQITARAHSWKIVVHL